MSQNTLRKAVVLVSGGMDSAVTIAIAREQGYQVHALSVAYGQRHNSELAASDRVSRMLGAVEHKTVSIDLRSIGGSALTADIDVPLDTVDSTDIPVTYVPARNTIMLSIALGWAEVLGSSDIWCGVNAVDYSGYPDCRPAFIEAFEKLANVATRAGVEGAGIRIHAPLMRMSKADIARGANAWAWISPPRSAVTRPTRRAGPAAIATHAACVRRASAMQGLPIPPATFEPALACALVVQAVKSPAWPDRVLQPGSLAQLVEQ